jgi:DNA integrity scanning protein DisA with diadenylate cyclase activity
MKRYFVVTVENDTSLIDGKEQPCSVEHLQAALDYWGTGHKAVEIDEAAYRASLIQRIEAAAEFLEKRRQGASVAVAATTPVPNADAASLASAGANGGHFFPFGKRYQDYLFEDYLKG